MGLLDGFLPDDPQKKEAARMALLAASLGMLTGRGRNFGEVAGQAGLLGLGTYNNQLADAQKAAERQRAMDLQAQQEARIAQFQALQMRQMQRGMDQEDAAIAGMREDFAGQQAPAVPQAPAGMGGQFPLIGQQAPQGPRVDPRQLPAIANIGASGVETFPVPGPFDPPPQAAEGSGEMERLVREAAMGGDRYAPPPSPEQQLLAQQRQQAERDMATAVRMGDTKGYAEAKKRRDAMLVIDPSKRYVLPGGGVIEPPQKPEAMSDTGRMLAEQSKFEVGSPNWRLYEQQLQRKAEGDMPADWRLFKQQNPNGTYAEFVAQGDRRAASTAPRVEVNANGMTPEKVFNMEIKLRGDWETASKPFTIVKKAYEQIAEAAKNPSPANDLIVATKFMKVIDEESVVRESELHAAMKSSGLLDRALNYYRQLMTGQKLTDQQRSDFLRSAQGLYQVAQRAQSLVDNHYKSAATEYGLKPDRVVRPWGGRPGPDAGTVVDGYRFKGGDPNNQSNWEPVQ